MNIDIHGFLNNNPSVVLHGQVYASAADDYFRFPLGMGSLAICFELKDVLPYLDDLVNERDSAKGSHRIKSAFILNNLIYSFESGTREVVVNQDERNQYVFVTFNYSDGKVSSALDPLTKAPITPENYCQKG